MKILQKYVTRNPCYKANVEIADNRYRVFQQKGPRKLMLHSVGCAQPSAESFWSRWNNEKRNDVCVHAVIDANTGDVWQCLPWNYRGWHCGGIGNNTHAGVEMCESKWISYSGPNKFQILDRARAVADCVRAYASAVDLFAELCIQYNLNPENDICSHKEGYYQGIASGHGDPEHYWSGLGMNYSMDQFRKDVQKTVILRKNKGDILEMTPEELKVVVREVVKEELVGVTTALSKEYSSELEAALYRFDSRIDERVEKKLGKRIKDVTELKKTGLQPMVQELLDAGAIDGGTPNTINSTDINMDYQLVRVMAVCAKYTKKLIAKLKKELKEGK